MAKLSQDVLKTKNYMSLRKTIDRSQTHVHPGLLITKVSKHKFSETLRNRAGFRRPREGRGKTAKTWQQGRNTVAFQCQENEGHTALWPHSDVHRTSPNQHLWRFNPPAPRGNTDVQPICTSSGTAEKLVSRSHGIYYDLLPSVLAFSPWTAVFAVLEEILQCHWLLWLTGMTFPQQRSLLHASSKLGIRPKCSVHNGKFAKSTSQILGRIHNPS